MSDGPGSDANEAILRNAGVRLTRQRRLILDSLKAAEGHPDAAEIHARAVQVDGRVSLATVYRTMRALEGHGAIQRHAFEGGPARFEQSPADHHDHLIDLDTGEVIEFKSDRIEAIQQEIATRLGYEIVHHRLELYGRRIKAQVKDRG
jgi:Fur family ferric uptake transcriptional regulator